MGPFGLEVQSIIIPRNSISTIYLRLRMGLFVIVMNDDRLLAPSGKFIRRAHVSEKKHHDCPLTSQQSSQQSNK